MNTIASAVKTGHGNAVLLAAGLGLIFSDIIPTPGDAFYFWDQQRLKKLLEEDKITPKQFWIKNVAGYYLYNSLWWALVVGAVMLSKGGFDQKLKLALGIVGGGAVLAVIAKNIKKDNKQYGQTNGTKKTN
jgi:hypothetical protein